MKVIFYENRQGSWIDKLIKFKTATWQERFNGTWKDLPSHVELLFSTGMMFSASQYENSTRYKVHSITGKAWDRIEIDVNELLIEKFCDSVEGQKYDYLGVLGFVFGNRDNRNRWFCSEVCCEALQRAGYLSKDIDSAKVSPSFLKKLVMTCMTDLSKNEA